MAIPLTKEVVDAEGAHKAGILRTRGDLHRESGPVGVEREEPQKWMSRTSRR